MALSSTIYNPGLHLNSSALPKFQAFLQSSPKQHGQIYHSNTLWSLYQFLSSLLAIAVRKTITMQLGRRVTHLTATKNSSRAGAWSKSSSRPMEEPCWLACSPWLAQPTLLYSPGLPCLGVALPTVVWGLLYHSLTKKMSPQTCLQANLIKAFPQLKFPLPRWL